MLILVCYTHNVYKIHTSRGIVGLNISDFLAVFSSIPGFGSAEKSHTQVQWKIK